ncbi:MAG: hypothetical protein JWM27_3279 [Gemmatimonadetes bacterium]|nr:hypothetical protein [Gemmatimonadota bacterium]
MRQSTSSPAHDAAKRKPDAARTGPAQPAEATGVRAREPAAVLVRAVLDGRTPSARDVLALQRSIGNRAVGRLLRPRAGAPAAVQRVLAVTADAFSAASSTTTSGFLGLGSKTVRLDSVIAALTAYEEKVGSPEREELPLRKVLKACDAAAPVDTRQSDAVRDLKHEVYLEAVRLMPSLILVRLSESPTASLVQTTLSANLYADFGISNSSYRAAVQGLVYDTGNVGAGVDAYVGSQPDPRGSNDAFSAAFKTYVNGTGRRVTREALASVAGALATGRQKLLGRKADREALAGLFTVSDEVVADAAPNRLTALQFAQMAELYSRIREGEGNVRLANRTKTSGGIVNDGMDATAFGQFQTGALADVAQILRTPEGRAVLTGLMSGGAAGNSVVSIGAADNAYQAGYGATDMNAASAGGTGGRVHYQPGTEMDAALAKGQLRTTSDTALLHELVHAYHGSQGTLVALANTVSMLDTLTANTHVNDTGVVQEEYATVGLGAWSGEALTENRYRASQRLLAGVDQTLADKYKERETYR